MTKKSFTRNIRGACLEASLRMPSRFCLLRHIFVTECLDTGRSSASQCCDGSRWVHSRYVCKGLLLKVYFPPVDFLSAGMDQNVILQLISLDCFAIQFERDPFDHAVSGRIYIFGTLWDFQLLLCRCQKASVPPVYSTLQQSVLEIENTDSLFITIK